MGVAAALRRHVFQRPAAAARQPGAAYTLTELGRGAGQAVRPLARWSDAWASGLCEDGEP